MPDIYKRQVICSNGQIYYSIIKFKFRELREKFVRYYNYLKLDESFEVNPICTTDKYVEVGTKLFKLTNNTEFQSDIFTYSDAMVIHFLYIFMNNTAAIHATMHNICQSFSLAINIIMKNDTYDDCHSFILKTLKKIEKYNGLLKHKYYSHSAYVYKLNILNPKMKSVIFNYELKKDCIINRFYSLTKEELQINAHIYKMNTKMFGANITEYENKKKQNISHSNSLKNKINIIESVLNNIINTNFDTNMNNIFNVYNLKLKELHEKINESIKNIEIVKKKQVHRAANEYTV